MYSETIKSISAFRIRRRNRCDRYQELVLDVSVDHSTHSRLGQDLAPTCQARTSRYQGGRMISVIP